MINLPQAISWRGEINRRDYLIWGLLLFAIKYNLDRLIAYIFFDRVWFFTDYFVQVDHLAISELSESERLFYIVLVLHSIPFIWAGTLLTLKRLRKTGLPQWLVIFFFLPFINMIFFLMVAAYPDAATTKESSSAFIARLIPKSKWGSAVFAFGGVVLISLFISGFLVRFLGEYGWGLFVGIPFFLGFGSVLIYGYHNVVRFNEAVTIALFANLLFGLLIFMLAFEGLLCLILALPILILVSLVGATIAYAIHRARHEAAIHLLIIPIMVIPTLGFMEYRDDFNESTIQLETEVLIHASRQKIWDQLVAFSEIDPPAEVLFKAGIAYPTHAEIEGCGVGAVRKCNFSTGPFIEPVTTWNEPELLQFSVLAQPPPMIEWSIYEKVKANHIDGYFASEKGQFRLIEVTPDLTRLVGTTWYEHDIWPAVYWKLWSDHILHKIHLRVLNHIKQKAEI